MSCQAGNLYTVPDDLRFKLILQRYCNRVTKVVYGDLREPQDASSPGDQPNFMLTWESNLNALNHELDTIEQEYSHMFSSKLPVSSYCPANNSSIRPSLRSFGTPLHPLHALLRFLAHRVSQTRSSESLFIRCFPYTADDEMRRIFLLLLLHLRLPPAHVPGRNVYFTKSPSIELQRRR